MELFDRKIFKADLLSIEKPEYYTCVNAKTKVAKKILVEKTETGKYREILTGKLMPVYRIYDNKQLKKEYCPPQSPVYIEVKTCIDENNNKKDKLNLATYEELKEYSMENRDTIIYLMELNQIFNQGWNEIVELLEQEENCKKR
jgi:hypothetical protein